MDKRLILAEDELDDIELTLPEDDLVIEVPEEPIAVAEPEIIPEVPAIEPEVPEQVVTNAYSDMLQDLLRKQWDVINSADSIIATLSTEQSEINKEDISAILTKLVDDTTISIGMVTKALGVVDPSQEELMNQGVEKAEEVIGSDAPAEDGVIFDLSDGSGEPVEIKVKDGEVIKEDFYQEPVDFSDLDMWERYWAEEAYSNLESMWDNADPDDDEDIANYIDNLSASDIKDICIEAGYQLRNYYDSMWETISECSWDATRDALYEKVKEELQQVVDIDVGDLGKEENGEE